MGLNGMLGKTLPGAVLAAALMAGAPAAAETPETVVGREARSAVTLTVYNGGFALIDEVRRLEVPAGRSRLALTELGTALQPETVILGGPDLRVLERVFAFDLLTPQRLLEASVGERVRVVKTHPETGEETVLEAEVLAIARGTVLRIGDRIETAVPGRIVFDRLPPGLRERPTLLVEVESAGADPRDLSLSYLTGGLSWQADYVARLDEAGTRLDLTGLVTVTNNSGAAFEGAVLRLVAGEVRKVASAPMPRERVMRQATVHAETAMTDAPVQTAVSDRYLYRYERPVDLADRETKQLTLLQAGGVAVARRYRFTELVHAIPGMEEIGPVQAEVRLEFENEAENGLGRPLPGGTVRVYEDAEGGPIFAGEDRIAHRPEGETIELTLGRAFDVTGEARHTDFERLSKTSYEIAQEVTLRNAKDEAVEVEVSGLLPPGWVMLSESRPHVAETANRIAWSLEVPAQGEAKLTYRVRISR